MQRLYEATKIDIGLVSQALNNTNATGRYFAMKDYGSALAILNGGAMAATKTTKIEVFEASDEDGTGAQLISGATATITANTNVTKATIALATVLNGEAVTINNLTFTGHTDTTTAADREFSIAGDDTADAAALAGLINDATYGVPGVTAAANTGTITLTVDDPGSRVLTISSEDATFTIATVEAQAYVELDDFDLSDGFTHIACKVTTTANSNVAVVLLRGKPDGAVTQKVGASASI
ncbi:MAG: hypothetical protein KJ060_16665 [Candidatus Hydrogenedentes bacterium]|nr:hypothetical protein [Candidatus Hydrogenedentota bacterium]